MTVERDIRWIARDDTIPTSVLRDFLMQTLHHDAIRDVLIERMVFRAERGRLDAHSLSVLLPELIGEVLDVATHEDWLAIADTLIEEMREALQREAKS